MDKLLQISTVFVLLFLFGEAVNPRLLRDRSPNGDTTSDSQSQYDDLVARFAELENELQSARDTINEMSRTMRFNERRIDELSESDDQVTRTISAIEERLGNGCRCTGNPGSGGNQADRSEDLDGWVSTVSRDKIRSLRRNFTRPDAGDRNRQEKDEEEEENIIAMGRAFASLMTRQVVDIKTELEESAVIQTTRRPQSESEVRPRPGKQRPAGFPFRRQRREVIEASVYEDIEDTFVDLVRSNKKCAFSAIRTQPLFGGGDPQVVTFQKTQANKGKSFEGDNGVFRASVPGIYYFSYTMRTYDHKHIGVALMLNSDPVVAMTTDASDRKVMQTQSAMLHLVEGDEVWLLIGPSEHFALYGNDFNYNTFNGILLYPNYIK
ncbi:uncharacterized protein [Ptychodera flava]|uniref:uncharacterized protein n=1 Tax=Ptychodera flava TaxID=63121 RepID=UPI003969CF66